MSDSNTTVQVGPGLPVLLFLVFLTLKLCEVITWSWWWVTAPLWIPVATVAVFLLMVLLVVGVAGLKLRR